MHPNLQTIAENFERLENIPLLLTNERCQQCIEDIGELKLLTSNLNMKSSVNKKTVKCMAQKKLRYI